jgi:hypothetical protein
MADAPDDSMLLNAVRRSAAASLAGGIIAASGRPHSAQEAIAVFRDVQKIMFPLQARKAAARKPA